MSSDIQAIIFFVLLGILVIFLLWFFIFKVKHLKVPSVYLITGGVKTGKSFVSVWLAVKQYKKACRKVAIFNFGRKYIANTFRRIRRIPVKPLKDKPMLYTNMHLRNIKYNLLTLDIVFRKVRIPDYSVCLIDEISLFADSMLVTTQRYKKENLHERLMLFVKLWGHYCGGKMIVNTQSLSDCAFEFKRCISQYLYIIVNRKLPFFSLLTVRELAHSEESDIINNFEEDIEVKSKPLFIWNKYYKYYDYRCYSIFTDGLEMQVNYDNPMRYKGDSLKTEVLLSLQDFETLNEYANMGMIKKFENKEVKENEKA